MWPTSYEELAALSECKDNAPIIVSEENGCKHIAHNIQRASILHIHVDGSIVKRSDLTEQRCDYLLVNRNRKVAYFIELKGSDWNKGCNQIKHTELKLAKVLSEYEKKWRLITRSKTLNLRTRQIVKYLKSHPQLKIERSPYEENI